jgi:hypothetical protein
VRKDPNVATIPLSTQDFKLDSDDLLEIGLPKTAKPSVTPQNGVIVRDSAYFHRPANGSWPAFQPPGAPAPRLKSCLEQPKRRSSGWKPTIAVPTLKMTATCTTFSAVQCSFSADYRYRLPAQILEASDDGESDTEDEGEEVYLQALKNTETFDHASTAYDAQS